MAEVRVVATHQLSRTELHALRGVLEEAFEDDFTDDDWDHTVGGLHVLAVDEGVVSHAAVVERVLVAGDRALRTGYVEGVATAPTHRRLGYGSAVMSEIGKIIHRDYELGGLSTAMPDFYARLGWELWRGPTYTESPSGPQRTADEDGAVMVLRTRFTRTLDSTTRLMCDWRPGDVW